MATIAAVNASSATSSNWLKEAQAALVAAQNPAGLIGALDAASKSTPGTIASYLAASQKTANNLSLISQNSQTQANNLMLQMGDAAAQKRADEQVALMAKLNPVQKNFSPSQGLDPVVYFEDGSTIDTAANILTMANGFQIDTITGLEYFEPGSIISMANGAYLNTIKNILTMADGTKIDTITGLTITA
jgi:hypothetical protein